MAVVQIYITKSERLPQLPVRDGNLIFVSDAGKVALDFNGSRLYYNTIASFGTDEQRLAYKNPPNGYYYVEDTGVLWCAKDYQWQQITPDNLDQIVFGATVEDFPKEGKSKLLYVADDGIYRWDFVEKCYLMSANLTKWDKLDE